MEERINNIFSNYRNIVKPLLVDIKARRADRELPDNFLNEIRALNDHIARCYRSEVSDIDAELTKAEGHLRRLIYDCFKQLNIYINDILERKENKFYSDLWLTYDKGRFWNEYSKSRKYAQQNVVNAKKADSNKQETGLFLTEPEIDKNIKPVATITEDDSHYVVGPFKINTREGRYVDKELYDIKIFENVVVLDKAEKPGIIKNVYKIIFC